VQFNSPVRVLLPALVSLFLVSCASAPTASRAPGALDISGSGGILGGGVRTPQRVSKEDHELEDEIAGVKLEVKTFDIPIVHNSRVEFWVRYFSGRGRGVFATYIERLGKMSPIIHPRLREAGLPADLIYLAMIESGFSNTARSHAGAVGTWQFMRATGRSFGLRSDIWVDERRDPIKATDSAIRFLAELYNEFQDWELATAAYNAGPGRIRRGIARYETRDYWELARRRAIRMETVDYVPKMMAAAIITKNARAFGFVDPEINSTWTDTKTVALNFPEDLHTIARHAGVTPQVIRYFNPELTHQTTPPQKGYRLRLPSQESANLILAAIEAGEIGKYRGFKTYAVRRGDTISGVAGRFGVATSPVMALNGLSSARSLKPGQVLILPIGRDSTPIIRQASAPRRIASKPSGAPHTVYVVKQGDTLYGISRRYDVSVRELKRWNALSGHKNLRPGKQLRLYVKNDQTTI
jgi:membrane-bound lytic murein transglycosylase D